MSNSGEMMRIVIKGIEGSSHGKLRGYMPDDPAVFHEFVAVKIGEKPGKGADDFFIRVATPAGLAALEDQQGVIASRPLLVMREYNFEDLMTWLDSTVSSCQGDSWSASVEKLRRFFDWEYDASHA